MTRQSLQSPPPPALPPDTRATILLLALAAFFSGAALRICDSLLPRLAADFGRTPGTAGLVVIGFSIAYGFSQLAFGPLGDRFGKARLVCVALGGCTLGSLACALAPGFDTLVGLRVFWGVFAAGIIPLSMAWIGDTVPYEQRQATLARFLTGTLSGMMAGQLAGGLYAEAAWGWRGAFGTLCIGYAVVALLLLRRVRTMPASHVPAARLDVMGQLATVLRTPWARVVLAAVAAEGIFLLGPLAYLPTYLHLHFGLSLVSAAALMAVLAVGGLVYALTARRIIQTWGERRMVFAGGIVAGLGYVGWLVMPQAWMAGPLALAVGFGTYLYHATLQTHATQMAPSVRGTSVAVFAFCLFVGQAIGVTIAGWAFDHGAVTAMLLVPAAALPMAGWWFARALRLRQAA